MIGFIILILPDKAEPVIKLNENHDPSYPDLAGLILMLSGWLISSVVIIKRGKEVMDYTDRRNFYLLIVLYFLCLAGISLGLTSANEWVLWISAIVASIINITFVIFAFRRKHS